MSVFLKAGIHLAKITHLRLLLEKGLARLTDESHLRTYIPLHPGNGGSKGETPPSSVSDFWWQCVPGRGSGCVIALRQWRVWDSSAIGTSACIGKELECRNELARDIITILCTGLQIPASTIIYAIRDGASVNSAAMWAMKKVMFPSMMNIICVSHTLDNVGRHMETPLLHKFLQRWIALFAHSPVTKLLWKTQTSFVVGLGFYSVVPGAFSAWPCACGS